MIKKTAALIFCLCLLGFQYSREREQVFKKSEVRHGRITRLKRGLLLVIFLRSGKIHQLNIVQV